VVLDLCCQRSHVATVLPTLSQISALASVLIIDIVLAGDNAIVVALAAASLPPAQRRRVILYGIAAATVLRILFALVTMRLLEIIGLTFAGGLLLLWVASKFYRELRHGTRVAPAAETGEAEPGGRRKSTAQAMIQIVLADLSMSFDNVMAVAGVARSQSDPWILIVGLIGSVALMGVASNYLARLLGRYGWIAWLGLGIVTVVALRMIWDGSFEIVHQTEVL
jgi:YjbE family integral membrane protein